MQSCAATTTRATTTTTDLNKHLSDTMLTEIWTLQALQMCCWITLFHTGVVVVVIVALALAVALVPAPPHLPPPFTQDETDYYSCIILCVHFWRFAPSCAHTSELERGLKENKYDDQTNSIKPNLLNPIQASKIPVHLKMLHPLVLIPAQCCLQQLFFYCCFRPSLSVFLFFSFLLSFHEVSFFSSTCMLLFFCTTGKLGYHLCLVPD